MKRRYIAILAVLAIVILLAPLMTSTVKAFNKNGPTPIPGDLIPFPGSPAYKKIQHTMIHVHNKTK